MTNDEFDIVIVGAGPAGCAAAYMLRNSGMKVAILDAAKFPRDKICGDALGVDIPNQLDWMDPALAASFNRLEKKTTCTGVKLYSPSNKNVLIPMAQLSHTQNTGFVCERVVFDNWFFSEIDKLPGIEVKSETKVLEFNELSDGIELHLDQQTIKTKMVIAADGANSMFKTKHTSVDKSSYAAGLRQYFTGVTPSPDGDVLELYFLKGVLPGYFWIFPLPGGKYNVGIGMLSSKIASEGISLKKRFQALITSEPALAHRFENATALESPRGFPIPMGKKDRPISRDRMLFIGDAGSLVEPLFGEGIANAIRSGRIAAHHAEAACQSGNFSAKELSAFDHEVYSKMGKEFNVGWTLQKLTTKTRVFDYLIGMAAKKPAFTNWLIGSVGNPDQLRKLAKPSFWLGLPFKRNWN